jgi:DNA-binding SARP family transcriptional activator/Flp pilus assembly protein TadD
MMELRLLGTIELDGGRDPGSVLARPRDVALLAYLAAAAPRGFDSRDHLLAMFWPDSNEARARNSLNQAMHRIRRATDAEVFESQGVHEVRLNPARIQTDVACFHAALDAGEWEAALGYYGGELLPGFHVSGAAEFERWLEETRVQVRRSATRACRTLRNAACDAAAAVRWAERSVDLSAGDEEDVRSLIELHRDQGDSIAAIRVYEEFEAWLNREMELSPSVSTRDMVAAIRAEQQGLALAARPQPRLGSTPASPPPRVVLPFRRRHLVSLAVVLAALTGAAAVTTLRLGAAGGDSSRPLSADAEAKEFYRQGLEYTRGQPDQREANWPLAIEMFQRAVERDPEFAAAHGELGMAHLRLFHWGFDRSSARRDMARAAINRSLELDPDLPEARLALGYFHQWSERDYERALEAGHRASAGLPDDPRVLTLLLAANRRLGKAADAVPHLRRLVTLEQDRSVWRWELASTYMGLRQYAEAERVLDRALALFPAQPGLYRLRWRLALRQGDVERARNVLEHGAARLPPNTLWPLDFGLSWLTRDYDAAIAVLESVQPRSFPSQQGELPIELMFALAHGLAGRTEESHAFNQAALPTLREMVAAKPDEPWYHYWLALALAGSGSHKAALDEAARAEELAAAMPDEWENPYLMQALAEVYIVAGEHETAIAMIERLRDLQYYFARSDAWLRLDPRYDPLRGHPRFLRTP